ncbi:glycosyltransferase family 4 protein [Algoriphagus mannitolivorans]|uniref:glycosyltransferase family 4 protein n=1 Tax=Algoriphagus mannitolivorans TaxID=226504 RepID=UPI0003F59E3A|nr:glycosyltransferase family 1 protein [Algoriphagus mannitolivorans]
MRILLDPEIFSLQKFGGVSRYSAEIIQFLSKKRDVELICPIYFTENLHLKQNKIAKFFKSALPKRVKEYLKRRGQNEFEDYLNQGSFEVVVSTYYTKSLVNYSGDKPFILTLHDMIHEKYPELEKDSSIIQDKKKLIEKATKIIAVSENTKRDIINLYPGVSQDKIEVIYLSHSLQKNKSGIKSFSLVDLDSDFLLFVGNRAYYKNFNWFIHSISDWLKANRMPLLCLGGGSLTKDELQVVSSLGLSELVKQYSFEDEELYTFYNKAFAFVFPSKYEGFGIPVLESMYAECPVVLPNHSSFPEVAGNAGVYFDLDDPKSLVARLDDLLMNKIFRSSIIENGKNQVKKFSWGKTMQECLSLYQSAAKPNHNPL